MTYGPDAVHEVIVESGLSYPVAARRLERERPMENVVLDERGNTVMLSELLHAAEVDRFESRDDLEQKLSPVCERESEARRPGVLGRLKNMFY